MAKLAFKIEFDEPSSTDKKSTIDGWARSITEYFMFKFIRIYGSSLSIVVTPLQPNPLASHGEHGNSHGNCSKCGTPLFDSRKRIPGSCFACAGVFALDQPKESTSHCTCSMGDWVEAGKHYSHCDLAKPSYGALLGNDGQITPMEVFPDILTGQDGPETYIQKQHDKRIKDFDARNYLIVSIIAEHGYEPKIFDGCIRCGLSNDTIEANSTTSFHSIGISVGAGFAWDHAYFCNTCYSDVLSRRNNLVTP